MSLFHSVHLLKNNNSAALLELDSSVSDITKLKQVCCFLPHVFMPACCVLLFFPPKVIDPIRLQSEHNPVGCGQHLQRLDWAKKMDSEQRLVVTLTANPSYFRSALLFGGHKSHAAALSDKLAVPKLNLTFF